VVRTAVPRGLAVAGWALLSVVAAAWLALVEVFWLPLRIGGVLVPVSPVAAVVGNVLLVDLAHRRTGSRVVAVLPALTWLAVAVAATLRRPEGDLVLVAGGAIGLVGLTFLLAGMLAAAVAVGRALAGPRGPARPGVSAPARGRDRAGSGSGGAR
jgi:hypothetical protein